MGVIRLKNSCLADWKSNLGDDFNWYYEPEALLPPPVFVDEPVQIEELQVQAAPDKLEVE